MSTALAVAKVAAPAVAVTAGILVGGFLLHEMIDTTRESNGSLEFTSLWASFTLKSGPVDAGDVAL